MSKKIDLSIVIPALNEEKTIGLCIRKAFKAFEALSLSGEVVVSDNGSTDKTVELCEKLGARVVNAPKKGYGYAVMQGLRSAAGEYLIMGDADDSYSFSEIKPFYQKMKKGADFVMGNRFRGKIQKGAMPLHHRYLGTPVITGLMNLFFRCGLGDANCGMRGMTKKAFQKMRLRTGGMEFATEMVIKATLVKLKIEEVPCNLYRDKRDRKPHLRSWRDGWRHLRFMLLFTPNWTFLFPGITFSVLGLLGMIMLLLRDLMSPEYLAYGFSQKHMISAMMLILLGIQTIGFGFVAKVFTFSRHFDHASRIVRLLNEHFVLERGITVGILMGVGGIGLLGYLGLSFAFTDLPHMSDLLRFDTAVIAFTLCLTAIQVIFLSFLLSLFYIKLK